MKFIISSSTLLKQLRIAEGVLSSNNLIPILDTFFFELKDNVLSILATDTQTNLITHVAVSDAIDGKVAVPAKIIIDILKTLPDQPITFRIDENYSISISSSYGNYKVAGYPGEDFPKITKVEDATYIQMPAAVLQKAIQKTMIVSSDDTKSTIMSGINLQINELGTTFFGTDAQRIVRYHREDIKNNVAVNLIIPKKPVSLLKNLLAGKNVDVSIGYTDKGLVFEVDEAQLSCRLIDGKFPDCQNAIPTDMPNALILDRNLLLQSVQRVAIFAGKDHHQIRMKMDHTLLTIYSEDVDNANEAKETIHCQYSGDPMEISFSAKH
jgi:DNA polymerase-3 subunit beta